MHGARDYGNFSVQVSEADDGDDVAGSIARLIGMSDTDGAVLIHRLHEDRRSLLVEGAWNVDGLVRDAYAKIPVASDRLPIADAIATAEIITGSAAATLDTYPLAKVLVFDIPDIERTAWTVTAVPLAQRGQAVGAFCVVHSPFVELTSDDTAVIFGAVTQWLARR